MRRISSQNETEKLKRKERMYTRELKVEIFVRKLRSGEITIEDVPEGYRDELSLFMWKNRRK